MSSREAPGGGQSDRDGPVSDDHSGDEAESSSPPNKKKLLSLSSVYPQKFYYPDHKFDRTMLGDAIDRASMKMLKEAFEEASDKNVITSPLGVLLLLSLYSSGAAGDSKQEIIRALGAADYTELFNSYSTLSEKFSSMDASYLTLANKVYVDSKYELADSFSVTAVRSYHSEVESINFKDPKAAVALINQWADQKTKGHIKKPVAEDAIDKEDVAALINVIFFQGHWNVPFKASQTQDKDFHVDKTTTVKKPTMHLQKSLFYHESKDLGAQIVELPYKEKGFRMVVVLPNEVDGLPSVLEKVVQRGILSDVFALQPSGRKILLDMPKFEIRSYTDLNSLLPKVGVSKIFTDAATGIVRGKSVKVSKGFQQAFVKVDEEGAKAGAFTGAVMTPLSARYVPPPPIQVKVDHPFLFFILYEDIILFVGTYTH